MKHLVICSGATHPDCPKCPESIPHEKKRDCVTWENCYMPDGIRQMPIKVRCVRYKGEAWR